MGSLLAPTVSDTERLVSFLIRDQEEAALSQLIATNFDEELSLDVEYVSHDGRKAIHIACEKGFGAVLNELLRMRASMESRDSLSRTPLLIASQHGHMECVHILLESGADYHARDMKGMDVIAIAKNAVMREIIATWVSDHRRHPQKPINRAAAEELTEIVEASTPKKGYSSVNSVFTPVRGSSLTGGLLQAPSPQMSGMVMQAAVDTATGFASPPDKFMNTLNLFKTVKLTNAKNVSKLSERVKRDRSLLRLRSAGIQGRDGLTPLHYAADLGNLLAVETLLEVACEEARELVWLVDMQGRTPLHIASEGGHMSVCEVLIKAMSADLGLAPVGESAPVDLSGFTPCAWNAREQSKKNAKGMMKEEEKLRRSEIKSLLFKEGDESILPKRQVSGGHMPFGISSAPGWRVLMEDAHCAFSPIPGAQSRCGLFGVFDGHGGAFTAKYAATELVQVFTETHAWKEQQLSVDFLTTSLKDSFLQLDLNLSKVPAMEWKKEQTEDKSGSTAVVAVVTPEHVVVANCGDCRALLIQATSDGWTSKALSVDHKPNLDTERARIEAAGSTVQQVGDSWRVNGSLAVARAFGDFSHKQSELVSSIDQAVTALPEVISHELGEGDLLLVLACDGIWDVMSNEDMAAFLQAKLKGSSFDGELLADTCDMMIKRCMELGSEDNMTAMLVRLAQGADRRIDFDE